MRSLYFTLLIGVFFPHPSTSRACPGLLGGWAPRTDGYVVGSQLGLVSGPNPSKWPNFMAEIHWGDPNHLLNGMILQIWMIPHL